MAFFLVLIFSRGIRCPVLSTFIRGHIFNTEPTKPAAFDIRPPLIKKVKSRYGIDGLAEVYVQLKKRGYTRSYGSMIKQISNLPKEEIKIRKGYTKHEEIRGEYPGDKVQVDIKYVPKECLIFDTMDKKYYQITAIDEFSRKRILEIVDEKSVTNTSRFMRTLEEQMGLKINTIQTDNGPEFVNNQLETNLPTLFELTLEELGMNHRRTRPYSPWQNGKVERSHKIDGERFYSRNEFTSVEDLKKKLKRYNARYNNIAKKVLGFKSPNQIVEEYKLNFLNA